jgi:hypothetical protein
MKKVCLLCLSVRAPPLKLFFSPLVPICVALIKSIAAFMTGSSSMLADKIRMREGLAITVAFKKINRLEVRLKELFPEIGWCFVKPDVAD